MKNCPECSAANLEGALRCETCGHRFRISLSGGKSAAARGGAEDAADETQHGFGKRARPGAKSTMIGVPPFSEDDDGDVPGVFEPTRAQGPTSSTVEEPGRKRAARIDSTIAPWANRADDADTPSGAMLPHGSTHFGVGRQDQSRASDRGDGGDTSFGTPTGRGSLKPAHAPRASETSAFHGAKAASEGQHRRTSVGLPRLDAEGEPSLEKTWVPGITDQGRSAPAPSSPRTMSVFGVPVDEPPEDSKVTWVPASSDEGSPLESPMTTSTNGPAVSNPGSSIEEPPSRRDLRAPPSLATQVGLGPGAVGESRRRTGSRPPVRRTLIGAPPVTVGEEPPAEAPMTQAVGYHRLEPKRAKRTTPHPGLGASSTASSATDERPPVPGSGLFRFPKRKGGEATAPERTGKRTTQLGTPAIDAGEADSSASPGAYVFRKGDISRSSQAVRISSSLSARRLTPPSERAISPDIGRTQQIAMPAVGDIEDAIAAQRGVHEDEEEVFGDITPDAFAHPPFEDDDYDEEFGVEPFVDEAFADEAIATLGGASSLVGVPGQLASDAEEGDQTDVQAFDVGRAREAAMVSGGRTMQISLPGAAHVADDSDDFVFGQGDADEDEDEDSPAATIQMMLPKPPGQDNGGLAHADTSELDIISGGLAQADGLADTPDSLSIPQQPSPEPPLVPPVAPAAEVDDQPEPARPAPKLHVAPPVPPETAPVRPPQPVAVAAEASDAVVRLLGAAAGVAMLLGVVFQVLSAGADFAALSPLTQVSLGFPVLGGLLVLGASALKFPAGMRALIIGLVGVIATMLVASTDLGPLADLGGAARRGAMAVCFALPMALLWRARYPQAFTSRIVVAAGILMVVANFAFLDLFVGDLGKPLAVVLLDLAAGGAVGAIVAGLAAVPLLLLVPSLLAFRGSQTDGLGSVWSGLFLAWTLMMPVAAGALAVQTTGSAGALLAFVGAGLAVFAAATAFSVGFAETFGRITTLPGR